MMSLIILIVTIGPVYGYKIIIHTIADSLSGSSSSDEEEVSPRSKPQQVSRFNTTICTYFPCR